MPAERIIVWNNSAARRLTSVLAGLVGSLLLMPAPAVAHPVHGCVAEIEWNPAAQCFEVALRAGSADLSDALSVIAGQRISLEQPAVAEPALQTYIRDRFAIARQLPGTDTTDNPARWHWLGYELELHHVWMYFEIHPGDRTKSESRQSVRTTAGTSAHRNRGPLAEMLPDEFSSPPQHVDRNRSDATPAAVTLSNTVLFDVRPQQINVVTVTVNGRSVSAHHTLTQPDATLDLNSFTVSEDSAAQH